MIQIWQALAKCNYFSKLHSFTQCTMREDYICTMHLASLWGNKNQMHVVPTFVAL